MTSAVAQFTVDAETRHQELLELMSSQTGSFDPISSIGRNSFNSSFGAFSLLPASRKILQGRDTELEDLVGTLLVTPPVWQYPIRHFIPCDSAHTNDSLVATIASYLSLVASSTLAGEIAVTWLYGSSFAVDSIVHLVSNLGNLHNLLQHGLDGDHEDLRETVQAIIWLHRLNMTMDRGLSPPWLRLPEILAQIEDHSIQGQFIVGALLAQYFHTLANPEKSIDEAMEHFRLIHDLNGEGEYQSCS
ncbi:hypothetical protein K438DRAFT_1962342 [Mycena galopus ATCC 62051]|nr:hypothetical protein K438DRAFT_1962342 [Mycena galopus ATCC 62051]